MFAFSTVDIHVHAVTCPGPHQSLVAIGIIEILQEHESRVEILESKISH